MLIRQEPLGLDHLTYQILTDLSAIEAISPEWDSLLKRSACNRAFSSSTWFLATCRLFPTMLPHVIVARRGPTIVGIFPLALMNNRAEAGFPTYLNDYNDIIASPDDVPVLTGLMKHAISEAADYERVILRRVRCDSGCAHAVQMLDPSCDVEGLLNEKEVSSYIRLPPSYEEYLATWSRVFRKDLRRVQRRAEENHLLVRQLNPENFPPEQLPEVFLALHFSRFLVRSAFQSAEAQAFVKRVLPVLFAERKMCVFALFQGDKMISIDLSMVGPNSLCTWNGGFLAEAQKWSPGRLLLDAGIKQAYAMRLGEFDLLRGSQPWKAHWATDTRHVGRLELAAQRRSATTPHV